MNQRKIIALALCVLTVIVFAACIPTPTKGDNDHFDSPYWKPLDVYNMVPTPSLSIIPKFATYQQSMDYSCGAASALLVLTYYGVTDYDEVELCKMGNVTYENGVDVKGVAKIFKDLGWDVQTNLDGNITLDPDADRKAPNNFITWVRTTLDSGTPIMVDWLDWAGHWQVIIGYDTMGTEDNFGDDVIIVADPADISDHYQDGYFTIPAERFFYMWIEETEEGLVYTPWVIATPTE